MLGDFVHMVFFHQSYTGQVHSHVFCCQLKKTTVVHSVINKFLYLQNVCHGVN